MRMIFYWQWTPFAVRKCCSDTGLSPCLIDHKIEISTLTSKRWDESESDSFSNQLEAQPLLSFTLDWVKVKRFYCCSTEPITARSDGGRLAVTMGWAAFDIFSNPFWFEQLACCRSSFTNKSTETEWKGPWHSQLVHCTVLMRYRKFHNYVSWGSGHSTPRQSYWSFFLISTPFELRKTPKIKATWQGTKKWNTSNTVFMSWSYIHVML